MYRKQKEKRRWDYIMQLLFLFYFIFFPSWPDSTFLLQVLPHPFIRNKPGRCPATCPLYHFICFYMSLFVCPGQKCPAGGKGKIALSSTHASPVLDFISFFFSLVLCRDIWRTLLKDAFFVEGKPSEMSRRTFRHSESCELCAFLYFLVRSLSTYLEGPKKIKNRRDQRRGFFLSEANRRPYFSCMISTSVFIFTGLWVPTFKNFVYGKKPNTETQWWFMKSDWLAECLGLE